MPSRFSLWAPVAGYMAMLFVLSSWESPPPVPGGVDLGLHSLLYCGLSALTLRALAQGRWRDVTAAHVMAAVLIAAAYGVTDEFHQSFVPGRSPQAADLVADTIGASAAAGAIWLWSTMKRGHVL